MWGEKANGREKAAVERGIGGVVSFGMKWSRGNYWGPLEGSDDTKMPQPST